MKTIALVLSLVGIVCSGCVSRYDITLANGDTITTKGRPHLTENKNVWVYTDMAGQERGISAGSVSQVAPQSMSDSPTRFKPATSR